MVYRGAGRGDTLIFIILHRVLDIVAHSKMLKYVNPLEV